MELFTLLLLFLAGTVCAFTVTVIVPAFASFFVFTYAYSALFLAMQNGTISLAAVGNISAGSWEFMLSIALSIATAYRIGRYAYRRGSTGGKS